MTKEEIEIIVCALAQLLVRNQEEKKQIEGILTKLEKLENIKEIN